LQAECHALGNCAHLESDLNGQKNADPLATFLAKVPFGQAAPPTSSAAWATALTVPESMLEPASVAPDELRAAIELRDTAIRADLTAFVRGEKVRVDLSPGA
jgi:hypothetical protein